jgi:hypothetical protein
MSRCLAVGSSELVQRTVQKISWRYLGKVGNLRIADNPAEIRTCYILNKIVGRRRWQ